MDEKIKNVLDRLSKSRFRSGFHLKDKDVLYIKDKGIDKIREHAYDFISKRIVDTSNPSFLIVIDALASSSVERVNKTIQITNTGIHPGSGVGNSRKEISFETIHKPVVAIGVPTVVDAVTIVSDTINYMYKHFSYTKKYIKNPASRLAIGSSNYLKKGIEIDNNDKENLFGLVGKLDDESIRLLIAEVLSPIGYNLMVTPKEVDFIIEKLSSIISSGINHALHKNI